MSYALGDATPPVAAADTGAQLARIEQQLQAIAAEQRAEDARRRLSLIIGAGSAIFAAFRLGILALPKAREAWKARKAQPVANPARRRRRRR